MSTATNENNLSLQIGNDCLREATEILSNTSDAGNLMAIIKSALGRHPESHPEIILAGIAMHDSAEPLRSFINEIGALL